MAAFAAMTHPQMLGPDINHLVGPASFDRQLDGETVSDFTDFCNATQLVGDAIVHNEALAEAIALLLSRAHAHGALNGAQKAAV